MQDNYISTGIHRCSILDCNTKFCENFRESRISADKRFSLCLCFPPSSPRPGPHAVCNRKVNKISWKFGYHVKGIEKNSSSSATHLSFRMRGFHHSVGLHHAAIGEAAVVFILIATPREVWWGASAAAWLGELRSVTFGFADRAPACGRRSPSSDSRN